MFKPKQIKLDEHGLAKILGDLEARVMDAVWSEEGASVRLVCDRLKSERPLSFNTVMTIMNRLVEKGMLKKKMSDGQYAYLPVHTRQEFIDRVSSKILKSIMSDPQLFSMAAFVSSLGEDPARLNELRRLIDLQ